MGKEAHLTFGKLTRRGKNKRESSPFELHHPSIHPSMLIACNSHLVIVSVMLHGPVISHRAVRSRRRPSVVDRKKLDYDNSYYKMLNARLESVAALIELRLCSSLLVIIMLDSETERQGGRVAFVTHEVILACPLCLSLCLNYPPY